MKWVAFGSVREVMKFLRRHFPEVTEEKANKLRDLFCERTIPIERPMLVGEISVNSADRGCRVVSATDPYGRILDF
jgi:hypothetical protein